MIDKLQTSSGHLLIIDSLQADYGPSRVLCYSELAVDVFPLNQNTLLT